MVGYFGSKGDHLRVSRNLNQFASPGFTTRPFPRLSASSPILPDSPLGNITEITSLGFSRYKALWVTANQRFSGGLQFNASYTLSESKDTNSLNSQGVVVQDSTNIAGDFALSDYDATHRYVHQRDLGAAVQGQPLRGRLAARDRHARGRPATRSTSSRT